VALLGITAFFFMLNRTSAVLLRAVGFSKNETRLNELASCVGSVIHCTTVVLMTHEELRTRGWSVFGALGDGFDLSGENSPTGTAAILWCTGYMVADTIYMLIWARHETLFLLHHTATLLYMLSCLAVGRGDLSTCLCIYLGEVTNPINNSYAISNVLHSEGLISARPNFAAACALASSFVFVRILYAPIGVCWVIFVHLFLRPGGAAIPILVRLLWAALPLMVTHASFTFLLSLIGDIRRGVTTTVGKAKLEKSK